MLSGLSWLALEVKDVDAASAFYGDVLSMSPLAAEAWPRALASSGEQVAYAAGDTALVLRRPSALPRGGLHTHYAFSIPADEYDDWWDRLDDDYELDEHVFGSAKSLYCYDPDGNCVELGQQDVDAPGIGGIFEVVLEVEDLDSAEAFYADLGFDTVDRGQGRTRVRMNGPMALELWEPQLGLADARGGVHVDLGFGTDDPEAAVDAVADRITRREALEIDGGDGTTGRVEGDDRSEATSAVRVRDPDGHFLTFHVP